MRILFLSRWYPYPVDNGSKLRVWNILQGLSKTHDVTLLSFVDSENANFEASKLLEICEDVQAIPWKEFNPGSRKALLGLFSGKPRSLVDTYSFQMQSLIERYLESSNYDLVIVSELEMAGYSSSFNGKAAIFDDVELGDLYGRYVEADSYFEKVRLGFTWFKQHRYLSQVLRDFNACTVPSSTERNLVKSVISDYEEVYIIPNCINIADYKADHTNIESNSLIFTGSFRYGVNYYAMVWFLKDIFPIIQSEIPEVSLKITGDHAGLKLPPSTGVILTGVVPDIHPYISSSCISVVPLQIGGGTRLKILEAMALRTPVVTTSKGAEGLDVEHGKHVLIADKPEDFANCVIQLLRGPELRAYLADNAYQFVSEYYDWAAVMPRFLQLIEDTALASQSA
ncbi:MAG: glycosyltransferase [Anaerolineales bacterium]